MNVKDMLKREEGCVLHAYKDSVGLWTIGYGRLIDKSKGGGITEAEADYLLDNDIFKVTTQLSAAFPWFNGLNEPRKAVLIGMAFQMGMKGLVSFKTSLSNIRDEHYANAAESMRQSLWAKQTPARALRMATQMETGEWAA